MVKGEIFKVVSTHIGVYIGIFTVINFNGEMVGDAFIGLNCYIKKFVHFGVGVGVVIACAMISNVRPTYWTD
jgi:hypothetical protein